MDVALFKNVFTKKIKLALVFFCLLLACKQEEKVDGVELIFKADRAVGVRFNAMLPENELQIRLEGIETPVLGIFSEEEGSSYLFSPIVPFTEGNAYIIGTKAKDLAHFSIPVNNENEAPEVLAMYPTADTLPQNQLKLYVHFSKPMQAVGRALDYIRVTDETLGKEVPVFLDLETELWNARRDRLTLWFDPGRIKTDLIPNREKGLPLLEEHVYAIEIDSSWRSASGKRLKTPFSKRFWVGKRDNEYPKTADWKLQLPAPGTSEALKIHFGEALDAVLVQEAFVLLDEVGMKVVGNWQLGQNEKQINLYPSTIWKKGDYTILIDASLEDMAGNNLNRLFDTNLRKTALNKAGEQKTYSLTFTLTE